jgi:hypothetical protein
MTGSGIASFFVSRSTKLAHGYRDESRSGIEEKEIPHLKHYFLQDFYNTCTVPYTILEEIKK